VTGPQVAFSGKVLVEREQCVLTITISRPEVRNAIDAETAHGLAAALEELDSDPGLAAARADQRLARAIAANGPLAVAATKRIIVDSADWPRAEEFARQREISEPVRASQDAREGALAFREKRPPRWQGR